MNKNTTCKDGKCRPNHPDRKYSRKETHRINEYYCKRCGADVINKRCECETSPSPWVRKHGKEQPYREPRSLRVSIPDTPLPEPVKDSKVPWVWVVITIIILAILAWITFSFQERQDKHLGMLDEVTEALIITSEVLESRNFELQMRLSELELLNQVLEQYEQKIDMLEEKVPEPEELTFPGYIIF